MPESGLKASSVIAILTDRDNDGDLDLYWSTHFDVGSPTPGRFLRNDGLDDAGRPILVDDAADVGLDVMFSAMGVDSADLNEDGVLDYCMTDTYLLCFVSDGVGGWFDAGLAMGLQADSASWLGWSVELADLDNDGHLDAVAAAAGFDDDPAGHRNQIWRGGPDGFTNWTEEIGFAGTSLDFGVVATDLDGDGYVEVVVNGERGPRLWQNRCGEGAWLDIELVGAGRDLDAIGAQIEVVAGGRTRLREVQGSRGTNQRSGAVHFGLGDVDRADRITVRWLDGARTVIEGLETRRRVTVVHGDAPGLPWLPGPEQVLIEPP